METGLFPRMNETGKHSTHLALHNLILVWKSKYLARWEPTTSWSCTYTSLEFVIYRLCNDHSFHNQKVIYLNTKQKENKKFSSSSFVQIRGKKLNSLAGNFCAISHHSPLLLICWDLNIVAVTPIITVPK